MPPSDRPIQAIMPDVIRLFESNKNVIIHAPTGSGKTLNVPPELLESVSSRKKILVVEPRRVACRAAAARVCVERGWKLGEEAGYVIRFDHRASQDTRLVYLTDGILLQQFIHRGEMQEVGAIVFDEFHERRLSADLGLAMARQYRRDERPDLRLLAMSGTMTEVSRLAAYLDAEVVETNGRSYDVEIRYLPKTPKLTQIAHLTAEKVIELHYTGPSGDILVFLPGKAEIAAVQRELLQLHVNSLTTFVLHSDVSHEEQQRVFERVAGRKIILSTNIAESSITIPGVRLVVDSGYEREPWYDEAHGINVLERCFISQASADQRAGRAGREAPGICLRLWAKDDELVPHKAPEIQRLDAAETVMLFKTMGVNNVEDMELFDAPSRDKIAAAAQLLDWLGAIDERGDLTYIGRRMSRYALHPRLARMMDAAKKGECVVEVAAVVAMLGSQLTRQQLHRMPTFDAQSELLQLYEILHRFQLSGKSIGWCIEHGVSHDELLDADAVYDQIMSVGREYASGWKADREPATRETLTWALTTGLMDRVAQQVQGDVYRLVNGTLAHLARGTNIRSPYIVAGRLFATKRPDPDRPGVELSLVMELDEGILRRIFSTRGWIVRHEEILERFPATGMARVSQEERIGALVLSKTERMISQSNEPLEVRLRDTTDLVERLLGGLP